MENCCSSPCGECAVEKEYSTHDSISEVSEDQKARCHAARGLFAALEEFLLTQPESGTRTFSDRCLAIAKSDLERASMYAIKAIVFEGKKVR